jgi:hypothetical protein
MQSSAQMRLFAHRMAILAPGRLAKLADACLRAPGAGMGKLMGKNAAAGQESRPGDQGRISPSAKIRALTAVMVIEAPLELMMQLA